MPKKPAEMTKSKQNKLDVARLEELLFKAEYINRKDILLQNLLRGMFFGAGSVIGATLVIAGVLWTLSLFDGLPLIGPLVERIHDVIQAREEL